MKNILQWLVSCVMLSTSICSRTSLKDTEETKEKQVSISLANKIQPLEVSGYSRALSYISGPSIPQNLIPLYEVLRSLSEKVKEHDSPDIVDIIVLIDTNGKTQTLASTLFLAEIEDRLRTSGNEVLTGSNLRLSAIVDSFVGAGSGIIPAAVAALGNMSLQESLDTITKIQTTLLVPKCMSFGCGLFRGIKKASKAIISAYFDKPELVVDEYSPDWDSLTYDSFDPKKRGWSTSLTTLFGASSSEDLQSSLECITLHRGDSIIGMVEGSIMDRDSDTRSKVRRLAIDDTISTASDVLLVSSNAKLDDSLKKRADSAIDAIGKVKIVLNRSVSSNKISLSDIREKLNTRENIQRDLIILSLTTDTFGGNSIIPTFGHLVKQDPSGLNIITLNYKFAIPNKFYSRRKSQIEEFKNAIDNAVRSVFPRENGKYSKIQAATGMLLDFLNTCNIRVLNEFKKKSDSEKTKYQPEDSDDFSAVAD